MRKSLTKILDGDSCPEDAPHWIVQFTEDYDIRDMTPLEAARLAFDSIARGGHYCLVYHLRSGLTWSVDVKTGECIEVVDKRKD